MAKLEEIKKGSPDQDDPNNVKTARPATRVLQPLYFQESKTLHLRLDSSALLLSQLVEQPVAPIDIDQRYVGIPSYISHKILHREILRNMFENKRSHLRKHSFPFTASLSCDLEVWNFRKDYRAQY
ncbi:MAG: hypothetical protein DMF72_00180 [Acidobacteria bacterium]|nr:MAG: hypothetical protein DMF72_00180 [Acidobacteriota bacterium]